MTSELQAASDYFGKQLTRLFEETRELRSRVEVLEAALQKAEGDVRLLQEEMKSKAKIPTNFVEAMRAAEGRDYLNLPRDRRIKTDWDKA